MRFRVVGGGGITDSGPPDELADMSEYDALGESDATRTRSFDFGQGAERNGMPVWTINGQAFDPRRIDARPGAGSTEIWELSSDPAHPVHPREDMAMMGNFAIV